MDSFIYALVLVPALTRTAAAIGHPGHAGQRRLLRQHAVRAVSVGWGLSMLWGPIADRFGRVRTLMLTILCYSVFTFLCAFVGEHLAARGVPSARRHRHRRRVADGRHVRRRGVAGGSPQDGRRLHAHRLLLRILPRGASPTTPSARITAGAAMFVLGGAPALLVGFIRYGVRESAAWRDASRHARVRRWRARSRSSSRRRMRAAPC